MNGPEVVTWNEYFRRFNALLGRPPLPEVSPMQARLKATTMEMARNTLVFAKDHMGETLKKRLIGGTRKTTMGSAVYSARGAVRASVPVRELLHLYNRDAIYVTDKAQKLLGYQPRYDVETSLKISVEWLAHNGLIPERA
jgi:nucleoside-diphosphate-sugar epimerase